MAAGKTLDKLSCYGKGQLEVFGSFAPNGASNPVASTIKGSLVESVVWVSTGLWLVTLKIAVKDVISYQVTPQIGSAANIDASLQIGAVTGAGTSAKLTFQVRNNPGGAVANIAANAADRINFDLGVQIGAVK
jgi:hypothetical protein